MALNKLKIATALFLVLALLAVSATLYPSAASPQTGGSAGGGDTAKKGQADKPHGQPGDKSQGGSSATLHLPAVIVDEVDFKHRTISVTVLDDPAAAPADKATRLVNLRVDKHVEIFVNNEMVPLGGLKPGIGGQDDRG